jgi:prophage regulatory protein
MDILLEQNSRLQEIENMSENKILRLPQVKDKTGLGGSQIYALISQNEFPKQIKLGPRASGWIESEVSDWIQSRIDQSRGLAA